ncbi:MAG: 4-hydroxy-tetrahydrodipicolinate synthase [Candidatus Bathyarchaeota archaeon]|nr:4-hydroxy-tetrahydrodipicolinate synthase [Candidatus Bathyarchaeota archaeon]
MAGLKLEGVYVPNVTPFDAKGEIQYEALAELIEYWIKAGVSGVVANASTGESPYLSRGELQEVLRFVIDHIDGRVQVIAGTGAMATRETIELTRDANKWGADAALITTPWFFRPTEEELYRHYAAVLSAVDLPAIIYNVPKFTGYSVAPKTIARIAEECSGLAGVKDSSGAPGNMAEIIRLCGDKITCLSGAADMFLPTLSLGGKGAILAIANVVPGTCVELHQAFKKGDITTAGNRQRTASHVNNVLVSSYPQVAAIKSALNHLGYKAGNPRQPLLPLNETQEKAAAEALKNTKLY